MENSFTAGIRSSEEIFTVSSFPLPPLLPMQTLREALAPGFTGSADSSAEIK
jgi:hypothetical protein